MIAGGSGEVSLLICGSDHAYMGKSGHAYMRKSGHAHKKKY